MFRKLLADVVNCENPFRRLTTKKSPQWKQWDDLRNKIPAFKVDTEAPLDPRLEEDSPWDPQYRLEYLEVEPDLNETWEELLLERESYTSREVSRDFDDSKYTHNFRARIEFDHLENQKYQRAKASKNRSAKARVGEVGCEKDVYLNEGEDDGDQGGDNDGLNVLQDALAVRTYSGPTEKRQRG